MINEVIKDSDRSISSDNVGDGNKGSRKVGFRSVKEWEKKDRDRGELISTTNVFERTGDVLR